MIRHVYCFSLSKAADQTAAYLELQAYLEEHPNMVMLMAMSNAKAGFVTHDDAVQFRLSYPRITEMHFSETRDVSDELL